MFTSEEHACMTPWLRYGTWSWPDRGMTEGLWSYNTMQPGHLPTSARVQGKRKRVLHPDDRVIMMLRKQYALSDR